jgi:cell division protein FtsW
VQPAEIAKVAMICWLAYSLSKKSERIRSFSIGFLPHVLMAGVVMLLCLKQPDFGSAVMVLLLTLVLLFTAGARLGYMLACGLAALPVIYQLVVGSEYRMRRITAFLSPFQYRYGVGYQIAESLMSFGAGGVTGIGIGDSRQKLFFLPEAHTDFISAIIGEELGFVGFAVMVAAYLLVLYRGLRAAYRAADDYGTYLAVGITMFIGLQAFTNLAVAIGLLPTKGLVLPFISYGGSALLVNCGAIGILLNVSRPRAAGEHATGLRIGSPRMNNKVAQAGGIA